MDVRELESSLRFRIGSKVDYLGIFTSDKLPYIKKSNIPVMFIANTLESSSDVNIVGHWVCFYIEFSPNRRIIFYDSYGFPPHIYCDGFTEFINIYQEHSVYDYGIQVQPDTSVKCGLYVLFFIHFVSFYGMDKFTWVFKHTFSKKDLQSNDKYVTRYYLKYLSKSCRRWRYGSKRAITYQECKHLNRNNNDGGSGRYVIIYIYIYIYIVYT